MKISAIRISAAAVAPAALLCSVVMAAAEEKRPQVVTTIKTDCTVAADTLDIPPGRKAEKFERPVVTLGTGKPCGGGGAAANKVVALLKNDKGGILFRFTWERTPSGAPMKTYDPPRRFLKIGPGKYRWTVAGPAGTTASLTYSLR